MGIPDRHVSVFDTFEDLCGWTVRGMTDRPYQHNNGPRQDQIVDNPSALCLALWAKNRIKWVARWGVGGLMDQIGPLSREHDSLSLSRRI